MITRIEAGIWYMLFASFLFALMGVFAKLLSSSLPSLEIVFFRNVFGVLLVGFSLFHSPLKKKGGKFLLLLFRGVMGFLALLLFFYNIAHIPLSEAMTYSKTSPIWTGLFAFLIFKESLNKFQWGGIFLGFLGLLLITDPFTTPFDRYDIFGILSGIGAALAYMSVKELKKYYDTRAIVLSFMGVGTIGPVVLMILSMFYTSKDLDFILAPFVMPKGIEWVYVVCMGVLATFAQIFMTKAYGASKAGVVGAISYSNIAFSILFGVLFLGDALPDYIKFLGIMLIVFSGILVAKK